MNKLQIKALASHEARAYRAYRDAVTSKKPHSQEYEVWMAICALVAGMQNLMTDDELRIYQAFYAIEFALD